MLGTKPFDNKKRLKRIILTLSCCLLVFTLSAQTTSREANFEKFYGTWYYENNGKTFTIVLYKKVINYPDRSFVTVYGHHLYKNGDQIIDGDKDQSTIIRYSYGSEADRLNPLKLMIAFRETNSEIRTRGTLVFEKGDPDTLTWDLEKTGSGTFIALHGEKAPEFKLRIPNHIILKRIK